jgi:DNA-3-methyladenine glycosylase II
MVEAELRAHGPFSLVLTARTDAWRARLPSGRWAAARQRPDGTVVVRASCERAVDEARFLLALDDDTSEFHRRFRSDPLLGRAVRRLRGLRPLRKATVAHATLRAVCGQLVQARRALDLETAITRACRVDPPTREALAAFSPAQLCRCGLSPNRAATLVRIAQAIDLERLRSQPDTALLRLGRERGFGPWSVGVVALQGLGRYDAGLVGDLGLVKLQASLEGRWPEQYETARLLEPYGEWQGLASVFLLAAFARGLVAGASLDRARAARVRAAKVA